MNLVELETIWLGTIEIHSFSEGESNIQLELKVRFQPRFTHTH